MLQFSVKRYCQIVNYHGFNFCTSFEKIPSHTDTRDNFSLELRFLNHTIFFIDYKNFLHLELFTCVERRGVPDPKWVLVELQKRFIPHRKVFLKSFSDLPLDFT